MRVTSKGQVTIPAPLRAKRNLSEGDEVEVVEDGESLRIIRADSGTSAGERLVARMRGRASTQRSTDEPMRLLRGE